MTSPQDVYVTRHSCLRTTVSSYSFALGFTQTTIRTLPSPSK